MSWMDDAALVCATKHCHFRALIGAGVSVITIAVDAFSFLGPSKVGDRITLLAQVNHAFGTTMEVGVRVEAQSLGGVLRHINTGYLTLMALDKSGKVRRSEGREECSDDRILHSTIIYNLLLVALLIAAYGHTQDYARK